jgi:outer membrane protein TolC
VTRSSIIVRSLVIVFFLTLPPAAEPLSLQEAGRMALDNNPAGREAKARVDADRARFGQSQAPYYPQLTAEMGYLTNEQREDIDKSYEQDRGLNLVGTQLLADFGKRRNTSKQAELAYQATEKSKEAVSQSLINQAAVAYFRALSAAQSVYIQQESLRLAQLRQEEAKRLVREEKRPLDDLSLAESDVSTIVVALIQAEGVERAARVRLANAMGMAMSYEGPLVNCSMPTREWVLETALELARESRPDLADARLRTESAESGVGAAKSAYLPDLSVSAEYDFLDKGFRPQDYLWEVRLNLSFPIFNEPFLSQSVALAEAQTEQAQAREDTRSNDVATEVQVALVNLHANRLNTRAVHLATLRAYKTFILTWTSYRLGDKNARDVSNAQRDLIQALNTQNSVYTELQLAELEMLRTTGELAVDSLPAETGEARNLYWPFVDQKVTK